ncbi:myosin light chain B, putative [Plasmodium berghei]|uniref:Myosin light chain B, putative n=2 Tax=Plasmodium berghei TaxID=5821 RepID=A0A509AMB1_PLABA|nr:myosin light chain B, putative [Plasmodium berghei ANKA]CXI44185.1 myosin light chain B, putative [Plasmodium berghei]SCO60430.1 myosin light chain B, putative [Plasmodium berghei]SCO62226.1 myosin light chain B, putative [Plasmodium berghei]VUC55834.1 myosin light chain B, putative [Plasmodium berghei ANKA]|eukprot:XP_034421644.1 myosin light chain B, putative [Plasmodium berghei ANKA]
MIQNLYVPQNNKIKNYNERKTTSLFRNNSVSFYNDVNTEAICLLDRATQPINYKIIKNDCILFKDGNKIQHTKKEKEFDKITQIVNASNYLNSLKSKIHTTDIEQITKPLGIYFSNEKSNSLRTKDNDLVYKNKYESLKKEYDNLKERMDIKIDLELIKAGAFYNKEDIHDILRLIKKYQSRIKEKKDIIDTQNNVIENIMEQTKLNRNKFIVEKKKNEDMAKICHSYYRQSKKTQMKMKMLKYSFLEYKMALENIVSCCEQIGGDKIILMDAIKSAKTQTDLSIATEILNIKKIKDLEMSICYCEHHINYLNEELNLKLQELKNETKEKKEAQNEIYSYKKELTKNNNMIIKILENYHQMMATMEKIIYENDIANKYKPDFIKDKKKYNDMVKLLLESNKELKNINDKLFLSNNVFKGKLKNHQEFLTKHMNEDNKNKHKDDANKISNLTDQTNETKNIDKSETEIIAKENNSTNETVLKNNIDINVELDKIEKIQEFIKNKNIDKLKFEDCVDIMYKSNIVLTRNKMEELKQMGLITANEFVTFIKPFIINEEEALKNMITFFEIWDVKKTGYMHKDLFMPILKYFGDHLSDQEIDYLQKELNLSNEPKISYADILKKWIYGKDQQI